MCELDNLLYLEFNVSKLGIKNDRVTRMDLGYVPIRIPKKYVPKICMYFYSVSSGLSYALIFDGDLGSKNVY